MMDNILNGEEDRFDTVVPNLAVPHDPHQPWRKGKEHLGLETFSLQLGLDSTID